MDTSQIGLGPHPIGLIFNLIPSWKTLSPNIFWSLRVRTSTYELRWGSIIQSITLTISRSFSCLLMWLLPLPSIFFFMHLWEKLDPLPHGLSYIWIYLQLFHDTKLFLYSLNSRKLDIGSKGLYGLRFNDLTRPLHDGACTSCCIPSEGHSVCMTSPLLVLLRTLFHKGPSECLIGRSHQHSQSGW